MPIGVHQDTAPRRGARPSPPASQTTAGRAATRATRHSPPQNTRNPQEIAPTWTGVSTGGGRRRRRAQPQAGSPAPRGGRPGAQASAGSDPAAPSASTHAPAPRRARARRAGSGRTTPPPPAAPRPSPPPARGPSQPPDRSGVTVGDKPSAQPGHERPQHRRRPDPPSRSPPVPMNSHHTRNALRVRADRVRRGAQHPMMLQELLDRLDQQMVIAQHRPRPPAASQRDGLNPHPHHRPFDRPSHLSPKTLTTSSDTTR